MFYLIKRSQVQWLVLLLALLSGCQSIPPANESKSTSIIEKPSVLHAKHMAAIEKIQEFSMKGRIAVLSNQKNASARLVWEHTNHTDIVNIYSPLGGKVASIMKTPEQVTFKDNKQTITADDTESLTQDKLGFRLPLSGLSYWALGKPSNQSIANAMTWDNDGKTKTLLQDGWNIEYKDYLTHEGYTLPRKVNLSNDFISIKLIVDNWDKVQ